MKEELLKTARFDVKIKTPKVKIDLKDISYEAAKSICEDVLKQNPEDETLQERLSSCMRSFGFQGYGGGGYDITISAYRPTIKTGEKHMCPQRTPGPWAFLPDEDEWEIRGDDKCCSYCGSLHPDRVLELVRQHGPSVIEMTDKSYKWYVNRQNIPNAGFGGIKYYRYHDTKEFIDELNKLFNTNKPIQN
jgi:hypothetical protein